MRFVRVRGSGFDTGGQGRSCKFVGQGCNHDSIPLTGQRRIERSRSAAYGNDGTFSGCQQRSDINVPTFGGFPADGFRLHCLFALTRVISVRI
jgi:hypothetical protein